MPDSKLRFIGVFQVSDDVYSVFVMVEAAELCIEVLEELVQCMLAGMSERSVANVVCERTALNQVTVEAESISDSRILNR